MKIAVAIPARYGSSRLPGKPLISVGGKPLIQHCYDNAKRAGYDTFVLTDDSAIADLIGDDARIVAGDWIMNGTQRVCAAYRSGIFDGYDAVISVPGDQPYPNPEHIKLVADAQHHRRSGVIHLHTNLDPEDIGNSSVVKHVTDNRNYMLWASRDFKYGTRGIGVYGFCKAFLRTNTFERGAEEYAEDIEQLGWILNGWNVEMVFVNTTKQIDINTKADVEAWRESI